MIEKNKQDLIPVSVNHVSVSVTLNCFFKCKMCSFWETNEKQQNFDLDVYSNFFSDLNKIKSQNTIYK